MEAFALEIILQIFAFGREVDRQRGQSGLFRLRDGKGQAFVEAVRPERQLPAPFLEHAGA